MQGSLGHLILVVAVDVWLRPRFVIDTTHRQLQIHGIETATSSGLSPDAVLSGRFDPQQIRSSWTATEVLPW